MTQIFTMNTTHTSTDIRTYRRLSPHELIGHLDQFRHNGLWETTLCPGQRVGLGQYRRQVVVGSGQSRGEGRNPRAVRPSVSPVFAPTTADQVQVGTLLPSGGSCPKR